MLSRLSKHLLITTGIALASSSFAMNPFHLAQTYLNQAYQDGSTNVNYAVLSTSNQQSPDARIVSMHPNQGHFIFRSSSASHQANSINNINKHVVITYMLATKHFKRGITVYGIAHPVHRKPMQPPFHHSKWVTYNVTPYLYKFVDGHALQNAAHQKYQGQKYTYHLQNFHLNQNHQWVRYLNVSYP